MELLTIHTQVTAEGTIKIEVPCDLPPGPVEVELRVRVTERPSGALPRWDELYGLGREVWEGVDAREYLRQLREDRDGTLRVR
jgi:hypothetical protein